ncbi:MAG: hypothetical protein ACRDRL_22750, partial [Sciscionella sp.]
MVSAGELHGTEVDAGPTAGPVGPGRTSERPGTGLVSPCRADFRALAAARRVIPVTRKLLADAETPVSVYRKLAGERPNTFLFESAENGQSWSRWSFVGVRSSAALTVRDGEAAWVGTPPVGLPDGGNPLTSLRYTMTALYTEPIPG